MLVLVAVNVLGAAPTEYSCPWNNMKKIPNDYPIDFSYCKTIKLLQNQEVNCVLLALFFDIIPLCYQVQDDVCKHLFTFCINVSGSFNKDYLVFILTLHVGINEFYECFRFSVWEAVVGADYQCAALSDSFNLWEITIFIRMDVVKRIPPQPLIVKILHLSDTRTGSPWFRDRNFFIFRLVKLYAWILTPNYHCFNKCTGITA